MELTYSPSLEWLWNHTIKRSSVKSRGTLGPRKRSDHEKESSPVINLSTRTDHDHYEKRKSTSANEIPMRPVSPVVFEPFGRSDLTDES